MKFSAGGRMRLEFESRGLVLIAVLAVIVMISLSAYSFAFWMRTEMRASEMYYQSVQSRLAAESGVELMRAIMVARQKQIPIPDLTNNPDLFGQINLGHGDEFTPLIPARFSLIVAGHPFGGEDPGWAYGLTSEQAKFNLNHWASRNPEQITTMLEAMVSQDVARQVVDRINPQVSQQFALSPADIQPRNAHIERLDELLQIPGVERAFLFSQDRLAATDRSMAVNSSSPAKSATPLGALQGASLSLEEIATLHTAANQIDGRINLNSNDLSQLYEDISRTFDRELARFVVALRVFGTSGTVQLSSSDSAPQLHRIQRVFDLVDGNVNGTWDGAAVTFKSPLISSAEEFPEAVDLLLENLTTDRVPRPGAIDITHARPETLSLIPGFNEQAIQNITENRLAGRTSSSLDQGPITLGQLFSSGLLSLDELKMAEPFIILHPMLYRATVVGYTDAPGPMVTLDVVVDGSIDPPRLAMYHETSTQDWPPSWTEALDTSLPARDLPTLNLNQLDSNSIHPMSPTTSQPRPSL